MSTDALKSLHTRLVDSRIGYQEALEHAANSRFANFLRDMISMRETHAGDLASQLTAVGEQPNNDGSFLSTVHSTVINVRALFSDIDEKILPGLIDGEERILSYYDEALDGLGHGSRDAEILNQQRSAVMAKINEMQMKADQAA